MATSISPSYINQIKTFRNNCDKLIQQYKDKDTGDFRIFLDIWRTMNFNLTYDNKNATRGTLYDFQNDTLEIAKLIMLHKNFSGGAFLLYGLYSVQEYPKGSIRFELAEFTHLLKMLRCKTEDPNINHEHVAYTVCTLIKEKAFEYVLSNRQYDMEGLHFAEMIHNDQYEFDDSDEEVAEDAKPLLTEDGLSSLIEIPQELKNLELDFFNTKTELKSEFPNLNLSLDMIEEDITSLIFKAIAGISEKSDDEDPAQGIGARRQALKNRKMDCKHRLQRAIKGEPNNIHESKVISTKLRRRKLNLRQRRKRKCYVHQAINNPDIDQSSQEEGVEDIFHDPKIEILPDLSD